MDSNWLRLQLPATLNKGAAAEAPARKLAPASDRLVEGIASTPERDLHGECVDQLGLDFSYFKKHGRINWDHGKGPENIIGEPLDWSCNKDQTYLHGRLYEGLKKADDAFALLAAGAQLAWSLEGRILERDEKDRLRVKRALVVNVALTPNPINPGTDARLSKPMAKSLEAGGNGATLVPQSLEGADPDVLTRHLECCKSGSCDCLEGRGDSMAFKGGYPGAIQHFRRCCKAPESLAQALAQGHTEVARATGRLLQGENA